MRPMNRTSFKPPLLFKAVLKVPKWLGQWLALGVAWLVARLPYQWQCFLGRRIGRLARKLLPSRVQVVRTNLALCFPEQDEAWREQLLHTHFEELGLMLTQTLRAFWGNTRALEEAARIDGLEHLQKSRQSGRGVLLVSGHFTVLDIGGKILGKRIRMAGVYRPHTGFLEDQVLKARLRYGDAMFRRDELRSIIRYLKKGGVVWYAPDQDYRRGTSVFVPFFKQPASTITATHQLARLTGCAVHFFSVKRLDKAPWYHLSISPALENFPSSDAIEDTRLINAGLERMVQAAPAQYLWIHKRFKTQPEGLPNPYHK